MQFTMGSPHTSLVTRGCQGDRTARVDNFGDDVHTRFQCACTGMTFPRDLTWLGQELADRGL